MEKILYIYFEILLNVLKKYFHIFFCLTALSAVEAQSLRKPIASPYLGLGAYSGKHLETFSVTANQAALAQLKDFSFGVYGERRFMTGVTDMYSTVFILPSEKGNFAFQADYFGYKNYNESQLGVAYARSLGPQLDVGIRFNYYSFRIPTYQQSATFNFELGAIVHLTEQLHAGIHFYNPVGGYLSKTDNEKLASAYTFGLGYEAGESFLISAELVKQENSPLNVNAGVQYNFSQQFFARLGLSSENETPYAGAGISWNKLRLDVSASYHPQLGLSPGLMLIVHFKSRENETP